MCADIAIYFKEIIHQNQRLKGQQFRKIIWGGIAQLLFRKLRPFTSPIFSVQDWPFQSTPRARDFKLLANSTSCVKNISILWLLFFFLLLLKLNGIFLHWVFVFSYHVLMFHDLSLFSNCIFYLYGCQSSLHIRTKYQTFFPNILRSFIALKVILKLNFET